MATMFPSEVTSFTTPGEGEVYRFLKNFALPDEDFLAWYSLDIDKKEPDFILFSPECGLIVIEVKGWVVDQIVYADPKTVVLRQNGQEKSYTHPQAQARGYVNRLLNLLNSRTTEWHNGKPAFPCPITSAVVYTNITHREFEESGLAPVMDGQYVLCKDDINEPSPLVYDVTGRAFRLWLREHFPPLFPFSLSNEQIDWMRGVIFPVVRIELPQRGAAGSGMTQQETILALDREQENMARYLRAGKILLMAPAGSGKSIVLTHQASQLPHTNRKVRRILFTCFNHSLAGYIRRMLALKRVRLGADGVEVIPFYDVCERILDRPMAHERETAEYYAQSVQETLQRLEGGHPLKGHWDAILVDEGQDFSADMARVLLALAPSSGIMCIAQDSNQRIYDNAMQSWEDLGLPDMKVVRLRRQYRNTRSIAKMAATLINKPNLLDQFAGTEGEPPLWIEGPEWPTIVGKVADAVADLVRNNTPMREIAILYVKARVPGVDSLPDALRAALEERSVLSRWASEDEHSKRRYDITTDSVTISTIHSVKGLDFAHVFFLGLDILQSGSEHDRQLGYVGMTRARESLTLVQLNTAGS